MTGLIALDLVLANGLHAQISVAEIRSDSEPAVQSRTLSRPITGYENKPDSFAINGFRLQYVLDEGAEAVYLADRAFNRKRRSTIFEYQNYSDLMVDQLQVDVNFPEAFRPAPAVGVIRYLSKALVAPLLDIVEMGRGTVTSAGGSLAAESPEYREIDVHSDLISRAVVSKPQLGVTVGHDSLLALSANQAMVYFDADCANLHGAVSLETPHNLVSASSAVLVLGKGELYFPGEHVVDGHVHRRAELIDISWSGRILEISESSGEVDCSDAFDEIERKLLGKLTEKLQLLLLRLSTATSKTVLP